MEILKQNAKLFCQTKVGWDQMPVVLKLKTFVNSV